MLKNFNDHIAFTFPFLKEKRLLLAVSGGVDSMVMAALFYLLGYDIALAHCNFSLRGEESDADETFVREFASQKGLPIFVSKFDTKAFAADYKLSTQLAARELRYRWFGELLHGEGYDYLLTAHHADDNLETFLINLTRGTGIEGLTGIPKQNDKIIRPLLPFSREAIFAYAAQAAILWREDSSNSSGKYVRNKLRHEVVPKLKEINAQLLESFSRTQQYLLQTQVLAEDASIMVYQRVAKQQEDAIHFDIEELKKLSNYRSYLFMWLREFGFFAWDDIYALVDAQSGKQVFAAGYRLLKDRGSLILYPLMKPETADVYLIKKDLERIDFPVKLNFIAVDRMTGTTNKVIFADADKLQFPLEIRRWHEGDAFSPFGMAGRSKKVSKFFKDEKLSLPEKQNTWLLCSGEDIVWIIGKRQDERFKVLSTTTNILQIVLDE
jgi:tRNA(Ile)-lysidine synthase